MCELFPLPTIPTAVHVTCETRSSTVRPELLCCTVVPCSASCTTVFWKNEYFYHGSWNSWAIENIRRADISTFPIPHEIQIASEYHFSENGPRFTWPPPGDSKIIILFYYPLPPRERAPRCKQAAISRWHFLESTPDSLKCKSICKAPSPKFPVPTYARPWIRMRLQWLKFSRITDRRWKEPAIR